MAENSFGEKGLGHLVDHQPAVCPCGAPGVLCPVLHSLVQERCGESPEGVDNKVMKSLQHSLYEEMLKKLGLFSLEKLLKGQRDVIKVCEQLKGGYKEDKVPFYWCLVAEQEAMGTN